WEAFDADLGPALGERDRFCGEGGKRVRPAFAYWTFLGAGGDPDNPWIIDLCAGLELLHAFALLHDDVMDGSDMRRHHQTVHIGAAEQHRNSHWRGEARRFGEGVAILLGDLALTYADQLMSPLDFDTRTIYSELKTELMVGQYLDLVSAARGDTDAERGRRIVLYKSAKYTVERPMHMGAALAGRSDQMTEPLSRVGLPLGEAFQLRDDLLGVFGSELTVGKPVGDDLREGKATLLLTLTMQLSNNAQKQELSKVGSQLSPESVDRLCEIITETGARSQVEQRIENLTTEALAALDAMQLTETARAALIELAAYVGMRDV
ncbi:MAG: polyprenyl synthetase family protein, partial [Actinomycetes bacterium]